ncbi:MAG: class I SAM-dependent methyltransferase [candidate division WOR-3 bacterium]
MGFDKREKEYIKKVINTEKKHQTDLRKIDEYLDYAYPSFKLGKLAIKNLLSMTRRKLHLKVLDIGAGAGAMSWLLAENGFDVWLCELEPNSLFSGLVYKHKNLGTGKRIVGDAKILPFENQTFDVVFCKEFAHHIKNIVTLFTEVHRVLKMDGYLLLVEPVLSLYLFFYLQLRPEKHFGHFYHTLLEYFQILRKKRFLIEKFGLFFYNEDSKLGVIQNMKKKFNSEILHGISNKNKISKFLYASLIGGSVIIFARKINELKSTELQSSQIEVVPTDYLTLDDNYLQKVEPFFSLIKKINDEIK